MNDRRLALITGGTKGLGLAVARVLLAADFNVVLTYGADSERAAQVKRSLGVEFPLASVKAICADVADIASIDKIVNHFNDENASLDAVVLNAGLTSRGSFEDLKLDDWERVLRANLTYPTFLLQRLLPRINRGGAVVFTGSMLGMDPHSMSLSYGVTKAATHALVKNLVKFLSPRLIRVNAVAPGFVDTEWQKSKPTEIRDSINSKIALGRFAEPEEIAQIYLTLIDNTYLNGEVVRIDGGYSYR
ncbi:SDR family oxidoreductase [Actinomycetaceae bacterium MB13-C1-2]|nr:SDR family oxidoreductase [Actinomycetaceae bacterium MB13-C1-2]